MNIEESKETKKVILEIELKPSSGKTKISVYHFVKKSFIIILNSILMDFLGHLKKSS